MAKASSNYMGLRVVLTTTPGGATVLSVSTKSRQAHWSEWVSLVPSTIIRDRPMPADVNEALDQLADYVRELRASWGDY